MIEMNRVGNMEDINAKREARRRRILENSSKRLRQINSLNGHVKLDEKCNNTIKSSNFLESDSFWDSALDDRYNDISTENTAEFSVNVLVETRFSLLPLLTNCANYALLASIVNLLIVLKLDYVYGKMIILPSIPLLFARLYNQPSEQEIQKNSPLYTVLVLCNIKPDLTYRFATRFYLILEDLALYIFSFSTTYYILLCYYHTNDIPIAST